MRILIVDDEINIAKGIKSILLANLSFSVSIKCADSGKKAVELSEVFMPELLITDMRMPLMTGIELIEKMKERKLCRYFIILSGYEDFAYAQQAIRKGVVDYLTKPVEKEYLCQLCEKIFQENQEKEIVNKKVEVPEFVFLEWNPHHEDYPASLKKIIYYIEQNYKKKDLSGQSISEELFFHPSYISQLIGKYTDRNLNGVICYFRLKKALELLLSEQNYKISEISSMVGFCNERQFYKIFQKYLCCTPAAFRKEYGNKIIE